MLTFTPIKQLLKKEFRVLSWFCFDSSCCTDFVNNFVASSYELVLKISALVELLMCNMSDIVEDPCLLLL